MKTLICTVGGSHQPIIKAIGDSNPDFILFVCSEDDPITQKSGSYDQIEQEGWVIKKSFSDTHPTLPNIPKQLGLKPESYKVLRVYADDLDNAYFHIAKEISFYIQRGDTVLVDYTGGTKTMSAALCLAAVDYDEVSLQLVTGTRSDLIKVKDGTEQTQSAEIGRTRFQLKLKQALESWQYYAYDDTSWHLRGQKPTHRDDKIKLTKVRELSRAFSYWDRFDHSSAFDILKNYEGSIAQIASYLAVLKDLCRDGNKRQEPSRLMDLWLNTQRRAAQQRYDDATSRAYRLIEWSAQWLLVSQAGIEASNVPTDKIPSGMILHEHKGNYVASLMQVWQLAALYCNDDVKAFWAKQSGLLKDLLQIRNYSILAHGYTPISKDDWMRFELLLDENLMPLILSQVRGIGMQQLPPQLPQSLVFDL